MRRAEEGYVRTNLQDTRNEAVSIQVAKDLAAGKMPSNQQIEEVLQKPIQTLEAREQTYQGKTSELATDLKGLLQSTQTFLNEKNQGQVIQDFVYHINMAITELGPSMEQTRLRKRETKRTGKIPDRTLVTADVASAMRSILYKMAVDSSFRNTLLSLFNLLADMFVSNRTSQQGANVGQTFEAGQINTPAIAQTTYPSATQHQTPEGYSLGTGTRVEHQTQPHSPEIAMEQQAHIGHPQTTGIGSGMETHREPAAGTIPTYSEGYQTAGTFSQGNIPITSSSISSREAQPTSIYTTEAGSSVTVTRTGTGVYTYTSAPGMHAQAQGMQTPIEGVQAGTQYGRTEAFSTGTTPGEVTSRMENLNLGEASSISPNDEEEWNLSENEDEARQLPTLTDEQARSFAQRFSAILPIIGESKETRNIFKGLLALLGSARKVVGSSLQENQEWTRNMNLQRAKLEFRIILEGLSGKSLQPLINAAIGLNDLVYQHPPILQWKQDVINFLKFIWKKNESELQRPENQQQMTSLIKRGRELIFNDHVVKNRFYAFFNEAREFLRAVERDPVNRAIANRFNVVIQHMTVVDSSGKTTLSTEGIENIQVIFLDILQSELQSIAIPRVEGSDSTTEWWVDNLFFKSLGSIPGYLRVRGSTDHTIDLNKGRSGETMGESGATHLHLKAGKIFFTIEGFQFYFARKTVPRMEDTGIADLYLNKGRGGRIRLNLDIFSKKSSEVKNLEPSVRLHIASTRCTLRGLKIRFIDAQRHKLLLKLFSPIIQRTIRTKLEAGISDAVHRAFARLENTINSSGPSIFDRVKDALAQRIGA